MYKECVEKYNAIISYHINIDDAYEDSDDFDPSYMVKKPEDLAGGIVHTVDWESGNFKKRMDSLFELVPIRDTLHVDNTRMCNNYHGYVEGIAELEELVCGLLPMSRYFEERGVSLTTEGSNGMPIDGTLLFDGWFHYDVGLIGQQMLHRKMVGGGVGAHFGELYPKDYALGSNIHLDFTKRRREHVLSLDEDFNLMIQRIYLGSLLYLYYLERKMVVCRVNRNGEIFRVYNDGTKVHIKNKYEITVKKGDYLIAKDNDYRCIPLNNALYIYSRTGGEQVFYFPEHMRGKKIRMVMMTKTGEEIHDLTLRPEWHYTMYDDRVDFHWMPPWMPYKITSDG